MGFGDAAADWHTDMPPSNVHWEVSDVEDTKGASDELKHGGFSLFSIVPSVLRPPVQPEYSSLMKAKAHQLLAQVLLVLRNPAMLLPSQFGPPKWKPMKSPRSSTRIRKTPHFLPPFPRRDAKDSGTS